MSEKKVTTVEAARRAKLHLATVQRWIAEGRVKAPRLVIRDGRAVRLWGSKDLFQLCVKKRETYRKGRGRKKAQKKSGQR